MTLFDSERASTQVLGFALMFSITMTTFAIYQADVVPHQNEQVEFEHAQALESEMEALQQAMQSTGRTGSTKSVTLDTAPDYPRRAVAVNPSPPRSRLQTGEALSGGVELSGFESDTVPDYWDGSTRTFDTRLVTLETEYRRISGPTYRLEHGLLAKEFPNGGVRIHSDGGLVSEDRIQLVLVTGDYQAQAREASVDVEPVSSTDEYTDLNATGSPATMTLPTHLPEEAWTDYVDRTDRLTGLSYTDTGSGSPNEVTLKFDSGGQDYRLRITKVGFDETEDTSGAYVSVPGERAKLLEANRNYEFTVAVHDPTGSTVDGETVHLNTVSGSGTLSASEVTTNADGTATFEFTTGSSPSAPTQIRASIDSDNPSDDAKKVLLELTANGLPTTSPGPTTTTNPVYTVMAANQRFTGLNTVEELRFSNGHAVTTEECSVADTDLTCSENQRVSLDATLNGSSNRYQLLVDLVDSDGDHEPDTGHVRILDANGDYYAGGELKQSAVSAVFNGGETDVLDDSNYDSFHDPDTLSGPTASDYGDRIANFQTDDTEIIVNGMQGRVDVDEEPND